jgi:serine phosphatase RsbU (regulator of sigma subunit)
MKQFYFTLFFILSLFQFLYAFEINNSEQKLIDSLLNIVNTSKDDTLIVKNLNKLTRRCTDIGEFDKALEYSALAIKKAESINYSKGLISSYINTSGILSTRGKYSEAMSLIISALGIAEKTNNKTGLANAYINMGHIYLNQNKNDLAKINYEKSLLISENIKDVKGVAACYNNIGIIYRRQNDLEKALAAYMKCLYILEEDSKKNKEKYNQGISASYNNIGTIYRDLNKYEKAIENYEKAQEIRLATNDLRGLASTYNNFSEIYILKKDYETALAYLNKALPLNVKIGVKLGIYEAYEHYADLYYRKMDYKKATEYQKLQYQIKDSILNEKLSRQVAEMNFKYDSEKKDRELIVKDAEIEAQEAEASAKELERNTFIVGFVLLLIVALVIFIGYGNKKSINLELSNKNGLVENQKQLVEEQNKKITSSINYAKRIQKSILPKQLDINKIFPESFVFFRPKDIVSGDFYWIANLDNIDFKNKSGVLIPSKNILIAAADSTGHGVPGALMSLMGINMLEQVVKEHAIFKPADILNELDHKIMNSLKTSANSELLNEGIDIALCKIDLDTYKLEYAGAHNSLYVVRGGVLIEIKPDKKTVGVSRKRIKYTNNDFLLQKGDVLYLFSDGFADQKGGFENKKYFYKPFQELLLSVQHLKMEEQAKEIELVFDAWKGNNEQIDDILVVGIKIV